MSHWWQRIKEWLRQPVPRSAVLLVAGGTIGLWLMDVATMTSHPSNGFWSLSGMQVFHLGMYLALVCLIMGALRK